MWQYTISTLHICCACYNTWGPLCYQLKYPGSARSKPLLPIGKEYVEGKRWPSIMVKGYHQLGRSIEMVWYYDSNTFIRLEAQMAIGIGPNVRLSLTWAPLLWSNMVFEGKGRPHLVVQGCQRFGKGKRRISQYPISTSTHIVPTTHALFQQT